MPLFRYQQDSINEAYATRDKLREAGLTAFLVQKRRTGDLFLCVRADNEQAISEALTMRDNPPDSSMPPSRHMAREQFMNDPEDLEWLFSTHLKGRLGAELRGAKSFVLFGNEDSPDRLHVYAVKEPLISTPYYVVRFKDGRWLDTTLVRPKEAKQSKRNPPRRTSHSRVKGRLLGDRRPSKEPARIGGYPNKQGQINNGQGKPTGWRIAYQVHRYRLPEVLSWMTDEAYAVVLSKGSRKGVGLSYGHGLILRGVEILGPVSDEELDAEARVEAEHWLSIDINDAEEQQAREMEAEE